MIDEQAAARALIALGWIVDHYPDEHECWFVGYGSHGGSAPSLRKALKRCLRCCKIGLIVPRLREEAIKVAYEYLGGWK